MLSSKQRPHSLLEPPNLRQAGASRQGLPIPGRQASLQRASRQDLPIQRPPQAGASQAGGLSGRGLQAGVAQAASHTENFQAGTS